MRTAENSKQRRKKISELEEERDELQKEKDELENFKGEVEKDVKAKETAYNEADARAAELFKTKNDSLEAKEKHLRTLEAQKQEWVAERTGLTALLDATKTVKESLERTLEEAKRQQSVLKAVDTQAESFPTYSDSLQPENETLKIENRELKIEISKIQSDLKWVVAEKDRYRSERDSARDHAKTEKEKLIESAKKATVQRKEEADAKFEVERAKLQRQADRKLECLANSKKQTESASKKGLHV